MTVRDEPAAWPVAARRTVFENPYLAVSLESIVDPDGEQHERSVVRPHDAVGVVAVDDEDRIVFVRQYRHPVRRRMVELPAGILDVAGEDPLAAAQRELSEETDLVAQNWAPLLSLCASPGYTSEQWHVFVASDLTSHASGFVREGEEAHMDVVRIRLDEALAAIASGDIADAMTVAGVLAFARFRNGDER